MDIEGLSIDADLYRFLVEEALPGSGVEESVFWHGLSTLMYSKVGKNRELLFRRTELRAQVNEWHRDQRSGHPGLRRALD